MDKLFESQELPKLIREEIDNQNSLTAIENLHLLLKFPPR